MPEPDRVIVFNDNTPKSLYLLDYLLTEGYNPKVIDVNVASTLEERFDSIQPEGYKVFLALSYEDLLDGNVYDLIKGLESQGWRNLIVLPFEGMTDKDIEKRIKKLGIKPKLMISGDNDNGRETVSIDPDDEMKKLELPKDSNVVKGQEVKEDKNEVTSNKVRDVSKKSKGSIST